jgi:hypothetical protein
MTALLQWPVFNETYQVSLSRSLNPFELGQHSNRMLQDGYTIIRGLFDTSNFLHLNTALDLLKSNQIEPVGIITHPLFWQITQSLHSIILHLLKEPYHILPEIWAWDIPQGKQHKGWAPHREKTFSTIQPNNQPNSLSVWIPITNATPENSCMYVLPACDDIHYPTGDTDYDIPLQSIRALPASPGDIIIFNHNIIHWGSQSSQWAPEPRRAMAFECQIERQPAYNTPTFKPLIEPSKDSIIELYHQLLTQYKQINYK